jgi:lysophospholipase L1-like esterase
MDRLFKLLLICLGISIGTIFAEISTRLIIDEPIGQIRINTKYAQFKLDSDPNIRWVPITTDIDNHYDIRQNNSLASENKSIIILGDSISFGYCTPDEKLDDPLTFAGILENNVANKGYNVLNLAVPGYDTMQEISRFKRDGLPIKPSIVVLGYCLNDIFPNRSLEWKIFSDSSNFSGANKIWNSLWRQSYILQLLLLKKESRKYENTSSDTAFNNQSANVQKALKDLRDMSKKYDFKVIVLIFPELSSTITTYPSWANESYGLIKNLNKDLGFDEIDYHSIFLDESKGNWQTLKGRCQEMHPDENGHKIIAKNLVQYLDQFINSK